MECIRDELNILKREVQEFAEKRLVKHQDARFDFTIPVCPTLRVGLTFTTHRSSTRGHLVDASQRLLLKFHAERRQHQADGFPRESGTPFQTLIAEIEQSDDSESTSAIGRDSLADSTNGEAIDDLRFGRLSWPGVSRRSGASKTPPTWSYPATCSQIRVQLTKNGCAITNCCFQTALFAVAGVLGSR